MAVSLVADSGTVNAGTTSVVVTGVADGTVAVGDRLYIWVFHKGTTAPAAPSGWSVIAASEASTSGRLAVFAKTVTSAGAQADETVSGLTSSCMGSMACFRGQDTTEPERLSSAAAKYKSQANAEGTYSVPTSGATWAAAAGDLELAIMAIDNDSLPSGFWVFNGTNGTGIRDNATANGTDCGLSSGYRALAAPETASGWTMGSITELSAGTSTNICLMLVLRVSNGAATSLVARRNHVRGLTLRHRRPRSA